MTEEGNLGKIRRLEDLKGIKIASFEKILEEVRAVARDKEEEERLLTERILKDLVDFQSRKPQERQNIVAPSFQTVLARKAEKSAKDSHQEKNMPPPVEVMKKRVKEMRGTDVVLVTEKQYLGETDLSCLSVPERESRLYFLTGKERKQLEDEEEG